MARAGEAPEAPWCPDVARVSASREKMSKNLVNRLDVSADLRHDTVTNRAKVEGQPGRPP